MAFKVTKSVEDLTDGEKQTTYHYRKANKSMISIAEVKDLQDDLVDEFPNARIMIRALSPERWTTLRSYDEGEIVDEEEYMNGKAADTAKFQEFFQVIVQIMD